MHDPLRRGDLLNAVVNSFPDIGFIFDRDGRCLELLAGPETASLGFARPDELVGRSLHDVLYDEIADEFLGVIRDALDDDAVATHEYTLQTDEGLRRFEAHVAPIRPSRDGADRDSVVWVARDITRIHTDLEAEERTADAIIESLNDLFYLSDTEGRLLGWNDYLTEELGYTDAELASMTAFDLVADEGTSDPRRELERVFEEGEAETTVLVRTARGARIPHSIRSHTFEHPEEGTVVCAIGRDISSIAAYEQQLETRNQQLAVLNRLLRHDIRNDMNVILGWGELMEGSLDDANADHLRRILDASKHVVELTDIARDLAVSLERESMPPLQAVSLPEVVGSEVEKRRQMYDNATFVVGNDSEGDPEATLPEVWVEADELLASVFRNLLNNAVQHNDRPNPQVTVAVEVGETSVVTRVADDGPGVPTDQKKTIFGEAAKGLESVGSGIGLYLVDMLVERYGGQVWVEDNEPRGAVFNVELRRAG